MIHLPRITCPYCLAQFGKRHIVFRCLAQRPGPRTNERCELVLDRALAAFMGSDAAAMLGPVFDSDGAHRKASCPTCGVTTYTRLCPSCHNVLPPDFAEHPAHFLGLIGPKESGKSTYMTVLIHELRHRVGEAFNAAVEAMDDQTAETYRTRFERVLYEDHAMLPGTVPGATRYPLLYRYRAVRRLPFARQRPVSSSLVFFDTAGEDLASAASIENHVRYLSAARGIILLVDPLQLDGVRDLIGPADRLPEKATPPDEIMANVTQLLRAEAGERMIRTPLAVVFSKLDALWPLVAGGSRLLRRSQHQGAFDEADRVELDDELRALMLAWGGGPLVRHVEHNYADASFFGVSALGAAPRGDRLPTHGVSPFRVEDAVLWLLAKAGVVPSTAAPRA